MVFLKVVLVGLASPRGLTVQCFPQEYFSPTPPFHFRCVGPYMNLCCFSRAAVCAREAKIPAASSVRRACRAITPWTRDGSLIAAHNMLWVFMGVVGPAP